MYLIIYLSKPVYNVKSFTRSLKTNTFENVELDKHGHLFD